MGVAILRMKKILPFLAAFAVGVLFAQATMASPATPPNLGGMSVFHRADAWPYVQNGIPAKQAPTSQIFRDLPPIGYTVEGRLYPSGKVGQPPHARVQGIDFPVCEAYLENGHKRGHYTVPFKAEATLHVMDVKQGKHRQWLRVGKTAAEQQVEQGWQATADNLPEPAGSLVRWEHIENKPLMRTVVGYALKTEENNLLGGRVSVVECVLIDSWLPMADGTNLRKAVAYVAGGAGRTCKWAADRDPALQDAAKQWDTLFGQSEVKRWVKAIVDMPSAGHRAGEGSQGQTSRQTVCGINPATRNGVTLVFTNPVKAPMPAIPIKLLEQDVPAPKSTAMDLL